MADRYFVETRITGSQARLIGGEAHHLAHVMRAKPGQQVTLFDGSGTEFDARVDKIGRSEVTLGVVARVDADRELPRDLTLAVSLPKGDRQRWLVEKATELGVARLIPLITSRSVAQPVAAALARLRRSVIEASKQCGRNRLMEVAEPMSFGECVGRPAAEEERWIAHRCAADGSASRFQPATQARPIMVAIGPEGGFTGDEVGLALDAGWRQLNLGTRILRVETAAIAVAACVALSD